MENRPTSKWNRPSEAEVNRQIESHDVHLIKNNPFPRLDLGDPPRFPQARDNYEEEAARDLVKSYEQLLADAHDELLHNRPVDAQKRIASITVRAAQANEEAARDLITLARKLSEVAESTDQSTRSIKESTDSTDRLTKALVRLTWVIILLTLATTAFQLCLDKSNRSELSKDLHQSATINMLNERLSVQDATIRMQNDEIHYLHGLEAPPQNTGAHAATKSNINSQRRILHDARF